VHNSYFLIAMKTKIVTTAILVLVTQVMLLAQKSWTLEECLSHAMENNLEVKNRKLSSQISEQNKKQSLYNFLPGIDAGVDLNIRHGLDYNFYTSQYEDMDNTSSSMYIRGGITVFDGLQRYHEKVQRDYEYKQSQYEVEGYKHDLALEIVRQYLQILYDTELLEVMKEQLATDELQLNAAQKKYELGSFSKNDFLEIKAQHAKSNASLIETSNRLKLSTLSLAQLLELDDPDSFSIAYSSKSISTENQVIASENILDLAMETYPHLKAKEMYLKGQKKNLLIEYGKLSPTLTLYGQFSSRFSDMAISKTLNPGATYPDFTLSNQLDENMARNFGLSLSIPIFSRMQNHTSISIAKVGIQKAELAVEQTKYELTKTISQSLADAKASFENYQSLTISAQAYEESYEQSKKQLELGMISASEYGLAKTNSLRANADLLHAKYNYILKTKILDFYRGVPITL